MRILTFSIFVAFIATGCQSIETCDYQKPVTTEKGSVLATISLEGLPFGFRKKLENAITNSEPRDKRFFKTLAEEISGKDAPEIIPVLKEKISIERRRKFGAQRERRLSRLQGLLSAVY